MTPVVEAIGRLNITGNVTPHVWYLRSEFRSDANRPDRNMMTVVADILYWYRPREVRDEEQGGLFVGYERKFQRDVLQYNYERRAAMFGMSEREMREACNRAQRAGLIRIDYRTERIKGRLLHNIVYVEPIPEAIAATLEKPNVDPVVKKKGAKRGRHVQADGSQALSESVGVDDEGQDPTIPQPEETSQNFGRLAQSQPLGGTSQNSVRSTSQNLEGVLPKFWDTYNETSLEISCPREGGVFNVTGDARAREEASPAMRSGQTRSAPHTTTPSTEVKTPQPPTSGVALLPPDGGAADAAATDLEMEFLFGSAGSLQGTSAVTGVPEVPRAGAPATVDGLVPVPPEELVRRKRAAPGEVPYRRVVGLVGGKKVIQDGILEELTPSGALPRLDWLKLTEEELLQVRETAQAQAQAQELNFQTLAIRALDRMIGAPTLLGGRRGGGREVPTLPTAYLTPEEKRAQVAQFPDVQANQQWQSRQSGTRYLIAEVTSQTVIVEGVGEYPLQKFHQLFEEVGA